MHSRTPVARGKGYCFRCCAQDSAKGSGGPLLSYSPNLHSHTYTAGAAIRPRVTTRAAKPAAIGSLFFRVKRDPLRVGDCV